MYLESALGRSIGNIVFQLGKDHNLKVTCDRLFGEVLASTLQYKAYVNVEFLHSFSPQAQHA